MVCVDLIENKSREKGKSAKEPITFQAGLGKGRLPNQLQCGLKRR